MSLPVEIIEKIAFFLPAKDYYNLAKTEASLMNRLSETDIWLVDFPKQIDWANSKDPYIPYDKTDFTIRYKGLVYSRDDGFFFRKQGNRLIRNDGKIELLLENLIVENPTPQQKGVYIGKAPPTDEEFIVSTLEKWRKKKALPIRDEYSFNGILKCDRQEREMWAVIYRDFEQMFPLN